MVHVDSQVEQTDPDGPGRLEEFLQTGENLSELSAYIKHEFKLADKEDEDCIGLTVDFERGGVSIYASLLISLNHLPGGYTAEYGETLVEHSGMETIAEDVECHSGSIYYDHGETAIGLSGDERLHLEQISCAILTQ